MIEKALHYFKKINMLMDFSNVKAKSCIHCCNFEVSSLRGFPQQSSMAFHQHNFLVLL